jgi:hypothetical protein
LSLAGDAAELVCEPDALPLGVDFCVGAPWARVGSGGCEAGVDVPALLVAFR